MTFRVREAVAADIAIIAADIRDADAREMRRMRTTPAEAMAYGLRHSRWTATVEVDGVPVAMGGLNDISILEGIAAPWLLCANGLMAEPLPFLRACKRALKLALQDCPRLTNVMDADNVVTERWLEWLGFQIGQPFQHKGATLRPFRIGAW